MRGRTVVLVSHHVQLCVPGAAFIVALDNGRIQFQGGREEFQRSGAMSSLVQSSGEADVPDEKEEVILAETLETSPELAAHSRASSQTSTVPGTPVLEIKQEKRAPRKLVEEEKRAVGRISREIWETYISACGNLGYWIPFSLVLVVGALSPVLENGWLR